MRLIIFLIVCLIISSEWVQAGGKKARTEKVTNVTNNINVSNVDYDRVQSLVAIGAALDGLIPDAGKTRINGSLANLEGENAIGVVINHRFDSRFDPVVGLGFATDDGNNEQLFRVSGSIQF